MASSVRIDGSLPDPGDNSSKGLVLSGGWAVEYDWDLDQTTARNQPKRLSTIGFPAPYDSDLEGVLRGPLVFPLSFQERTEASGSNYDAGRTRRPNRARLGATRRLDKF